LTISKPVESSPYRHTYVCQTEPTILDHIVVLINE
jgi:hypothetical protein